MKAKQVLKLLKITRYFSKISKFVLPVATQGFLMIVVNLLLN